MIAGVSGTSSSRMGKIVYSTAAFLNLTGLGLGILYTLVPSAEGVSFWFGWILPLACAAACISCVRSSVSRPLAKLYLAWTCAGFAVLPFLLIARASFQAADLFDAASRLLVLGSLVLGALAAVGSLKPGTVESDPMAKTMSPDARTVSPAPSYNPAAAALGFFFGIAALAVTARFLTGPHPKTAGVLIPQCLPYWSIAFLPVGALTVRAGNGGPDTRRGAPLLALPAAAAAVLALTPVFQTPGVLRTAEHDFSEAFESGRDATTPFGDRAYAFSLGRMFLGTRAGRIRPVLDAPYHTETAPDGRTFTFRYDLWSPAGSGPHPVLIRIHGGGWNSGDKAFGNMNYVNRHFAELGYLVFDIQYGLAEAGTFSLRAPTPKGMVGPFGIEDMLRHIGVFSFYLADRAGEFGADPSRVFVSGASAGGHLALAVTLTSTSAYTRDHPGIGLDPRITVRGVIPFYPGIGYAAGMGIPTRPELDTLEPLLGPGNPPALFYQGVLDGMVDSKRVRSFVRAYDRAGGGRAVLVEFPSAGHGVNTDIDFPLFTEVNVPLFSADFHSKPTAPIFIRSFMRYESAFKLKT